MTTATGTPQGTKEEEEERGFLATRHKSAACTHVSNPRSHSDQTAETYHRLHPNSGLFPCISARECEAWERGCRTTVNSLDKDNVLKDHPEKYLLKKPEPGLPNLPPADFPDPYIYDIRVAQVVKNERVTPESHWQDVRKLEFQLLHVLPEGEEKPKFFAGSTISIRPKNYPEDAQTLIELMGWQDVADTVLDLEELRKDRGELTINGPFPRKFRPIEDATLRDLLIHDLDITAVPKRSFIRDLINMTDVPKEKERLKELTIPGNEQEFYDYTSRPRRTILELLRDFPGVKIPWVEVLDHFSLIRPREFSISDAEVVSFNEADSTIVVRLEILAALVEYKTLIRKPRQGLCSRYLKHLPVGREIEFTFHPNVNPILFPTLWNRSRPVIAVATGTGIAPIRAFIKDRAVPQNGLPDPGPVLLFFGCRNQNADFYYREEWEAANNITVIPAFSRDPVDPEIAADLNPYHRLSPYTQSREDGGHGLTEVGPSFEEIPVQGYDAGKNYVQHQIRRHAVAVGAVMLHSPIILVCGNAGKMPTSVRAALADALVISQVVENKEQAISFLDNKLKVLYWQECW